jgi:hypothetical protein
MSSSSLQTAYKSKGTTVQAKYRPDSIEWVSVMPHATEAHWQKLTPREVLIRNAVGFI